MKLIRLNEYCDVNHYTFEPTSILTKTIWVNAEKIISMEFSSTSPKLPIKQFLKVYVEGNDRPICAANTVKDIMESYDEIQRKESND